MYRATKALFSVAIAVGLPLAAAADDKEEKKAPPEFQVKLELDTGIVIVDVTREWSPIGADRFYNAVNEGFFDGCRFFRVVPDFIVQFGINGDPKKQARMRDSVIKDDPRNKSNKAKTLTFATAGPNTRTSQLFFNLRDNDFLDGQGFTPFGVVSKGWGAIEKINSEYGQRPNQGRIQQGGNEYLKENFPNLSYIKKASVVKPE